MDKTRVPFLKATYFLITNSISLVVTIFSSFVNFSPWVIIGMFLRNVVTSLISNLLAKVAQSILLIILSERRESESRSVMSNSLRPHRLHSPWNSPGQNTGVGSLPLLQGIFPIQGSNPGLPHCRQILYQLSHTNNSKVSEKSAVVKHGSDPLLFLVWFFPPLLSVLYFLLCLLLSFHWGRLHFISVFA